MKDFEYMFSANENMGINDEVGYSFKKGTNNIIISAPHTVKCIRNGEVKQNEINTGSIALNLYEATNVSVMYKTCTTDDDPNYSEVSSYRDELINQVNIINASVVLDIHGMMDDTYDIEIGINELKNIKNDTIFLTFIKKFWDNTMFNVCYDRKFKASYEYTVSKVVSSNTNAYCLQLEISKAIRTNNDKLDLLLEHLSLFIKELESVSINKKGIIKNINKYYPYNMLGIAKPRTNLDGSDFVNYECKKLYDFNSLKVICDNFEKEDINYFKRGLASQIDKYNSFYKIPKIKINRVLKAQTNTLEENILNVDINTYNFIKSYGTDYACIYNKTFETMGVFKIVPAESKDSACVWTSYRQRELLDMEPRQYYFDDELMYLKRKFKLDNVQMYDLLNKCYHKSDANDKYTFSIRGLKENSFNSDEESLKHEISKNYKKLLEVYLFPSVNYNEVNKSFFDYLVGFSASELKVISAISMDEGLKVVRISKDIAKRMDILENERIVLYNTNSKISCRVLINENLSNSVISVPKNIKNRMNVSDGMLIKIKRDNKFIFIKKLSSNTLNILLTIISVYSSMQIFESSNTWLFVVLTIIIIALIFYTSINDRKNNVKK